MTGRVASKLCSSCGREITWRKGWEKVWAEVRYCSDGCRRRRVNDTDRALEQAILSLLAQRARGATICPSEAARAVGGAEWRELMEPARAAARRLQGVGAVVITQQGRPVEPSRARGPIRIRLT
jgi:hypothetical protein